MSLEHPFDSVAIIGLGLIGGSLAKAMAHKTPDTLVVGFDTSEVMGAAVTEGVITDGLLSLTDPMLDTVDLVVLGCHVMANQEVLKTLAQSRRESPLYVLDLGSTKGSICQLAETLGDKIIFLGGHPLAGREVGGYANSRATLFDGKRFLLTPTQTTPPQFVARVSAWLKVLGADPVELTPQAHDQLMALVSHFPQLYAVALANLLSQNTPQQTLHFLGGGIDDQMRLMASPYEMWRDVYADNRHNVLEVLDQFMAILSQMRDAVAQDQLAPWFETSHNVYALYQEYKASPVG